MYGHGYTVPFAPQGDLCPLALLVGLLLHRRREANSAHDAIAELLVQDRLVRIAVILYNLEQAIHQRIFRGHIQSSSSVGESSEVCLELFSGDIQYFGKLLDVLRRGHGLSVEQSSDCYLLTSDLLCNGLEGEVLLLLRIEEGYRGGRKARS